MHDDDPQPDSFEEMLRSIAEELTRSVERAVEQVDLSEIAESFGLDPDRARDWVDMAGRWFRTAGERLGDEFADRWPSGPPFGPPSGPPFGPSGHGPGEPPGGAPGDASRGTGTEPDPLRSAQPHPLDIPTDEQGLALAALESGRWTIEPGTHALEAHAEGPGPSDALGLARELRARDWIAADGQVTLVGRDALRRWLAARNRE